ncbi:unnamed protein product, partial [Symbiodinium necroappetens]
PLCFREISHLLHPLLWSRRPGTVDVDMEQNLRILLEEWRQVGAMQTGQEEQDVIRNLAESANVDPKAVQLLWLSVARQARPAAGEPTPTVYPELAKRHHGISVEVVDLGQYSEKHSNSCMFLTCAITLADRRLQGREDAQLLGTLGDQLEAIAPTAQVIALWRGDVVLPNVMLSDVMASGPLYEAVYTWGFSISMVCVCFVFREASTFWRQNLPGLAPDVDRFVFMLYTLCAPCLLGLVAFQYKHDMSLSAASLGDLLYDFDFLLWALHAFHTSVFFLTCCAMAYIYGLRLSPALDEKGLTHPSDKFWRRSGTWCILMLTPVGVVFRLLHLFLGTSLWGILLVLVEVLLRTLGLAALLGVLQTQAVTVMCQRFGPDPNVNDNRATENCMKALGEEFQNILDPTKCATQCDKATCPSSEGLCQGAHREVELGLESLSEGRMADALRHAACELLRDDKEFFLPFFHPVYLPDAGTPPTYDRWVESLRGSEEGDELVILALAMLCGMAVQPVQKSGYRVPVMDPCDAKESAILALSLDSCVCSGPWKVILGILGE